MGVLEAFIVCPSYIVRKGLRHLLNNYPGIQVVLEMDNASRLSDELKHRQPSLIFCTPEGLTDIDLHRFDSITWVGITEGEDVLVYGFEYAIDTREGIETLTERLQEIESKVIASGAEPVVALSEREMEVLKEVVKGNLNKEIAEHLFISPHTVITHRKNITRKLGIRTVAGLTVYAILNGIINIQDVAPSDNIENRSP